MGSFNIRSGGAWHPATAVHVHASGAWRTANEVWVNVQGVWRLAWTAADYVLDAVDWANISGASSGIGSVNANNATKTISGINRTTTLKLTISNTSASASYPSGGGSSSGEVYAVVGGVAQTACTWTELSVGTQEATFTVTNGASVYFYASLAFTDTIYETPVSGTGGCTCTVTNVSAGGTIDTFTVSLST